MTNERKKDGLMFRSAGLEVRQEGEDQSLRISVSSEEPCITYGYVDDQYRKFYEILGHGEGEIDTTRMQDGLVCLDTHWGDQIGLATATKAENGKLYATEMKWSSTERAQNLMNDVLNGVRKNVSVGYIPDPKSYEYVGERDGLPVYRSTSWMPYEFSFVPVPADHSVGVGRSKHEGDEMSDKETQEREAQEKAEREKLEQEQKERELKMENERKEIEAKAREEARKAEQSRVRELLALGKAHGREEEAQQAIEDGTELEQFRAELLDSLKIEREEKGKVTMNAPNVQVPEKREYNLNRAILSLDPNSNVDAGFEREVSQEIAKRRGKQPQGIFTPLGMRDFSVSGTGSNIVETDLKSDQFIDQLRNRMVTAQMGATMMMGLEGDVAIPKQTAASTAYWISTEGNAITSESQPTLSQITLTPHTLGAYTDITRKLLLQSSIDAQNLVRNDLQKVVGLEIDRAAMFGTNASGQPKGLINITGVNDISCTAGGMTFAEALNFERDIEIDNADIGEMGWVTTPTIKALMRNTKKDTGSGQFLWEDDNTVNGYRAMVSNQVTAQYVLFGVWSQLVIGMWGGLDLTVDPYTNSTSGTLRIVALQDVDVACRYGKAFAITDDITG